MLVSPLRDTTVMPEPTVTTIEERAVDPRWRRYDRYAWLLVATVVVALAAATLLGSGADTPTGRLGGDYPAFYGAGSIVLDGDAGELYDAARQVGAQEGLLGEGDVLFFAYPPPVAALYAPLAALPYRASYLVHSLAMLAALVVSLTLLRPVSPWLRRFPGISLAVALTFYPMLRAVTGGQNTALTVLLLALGFRLERDGRGFLAGVAVAALLYKPQFGVPMAGLLLLPPRRALLQGWAVGATGFYGLGALLSGPDWPVSWWDEASTFADINEGVNGFLFVSLPGMVANWLGSSDARLLWAFAMLMAVAGAVAIWMGADAPARRWSLTGASVVLAAPQALYYEAGLLVPAVAVSGERLAIVAGLWALSWTQVAADGLGWSPLGIIMPVAVVWLAVRTARAGRVETMRVTTSGGTLPT